MRTRPVTMNMQALIQKARAAAGGVQASRSYSGRSQNMAIVAVWHNDERIWQFSGPESHAEAQAEAFTKVLKDHGVEAWWSSRVD